MDKDELIEKFAKKVKELENAQLKENIAQVKETEAKNKLEAVEAHSKKVVEVNY